MGQMRNTSALSIIFPKRRVVRKKKVTNRKFTAYDATVAIAAPFGPYAGIRAKFKATFAIAAVEVLINENQVKPSLTSQSVSTPPTL
jgi:hypothetical protein